MPGATSKRERFRDRIVSGILVLAGFWLQFATAALPTRAADGTSPSAVDFARDIRPLFNKQCTSCHGGVKRAGGLSFLSREGALAETKSGKRAIVPGDPNASELLKRVTTQNADDRMPPTDHGQALSPTDVDKLTAWIQTGANWTRHWAYEKPVRPAIPSVQQRDWPKQDLDRFVLARLEFEKLTPSTEADRAAWLRRASFDLTGLPPSPKDVTAFLSDASPQAFEHVVDRLLASQHFGERWATLWLDLARYADTMGYERDPSRVVWPWRDWVIRAFNADMGYDDFVRRQLAGDLLPNATDDDRLATAFHRNTQTNAEDGTDDEEYRLAAVIDRIATTWEGLAATSLRCVQCHNHPYDPFSHEEFYRVAALFNTTRDHDATEDFPLLRVAQNTEDRDRFSAQLAAFRETRLSLQAEGNALASRTPWRPLQPTQVRSTGQATLAIRKAPQDQVPEVVASGTITLHSIYTIDSAISGPETLTALRLEVLPENEEKAASIPELGFVLSRLQVQILAPSPATNVAEVTFVGAYDEDPDAFFPVEATLQEDAAGWSAYPRFHRKRRAVFVPQSPIHLNPGETLRLSLSQDVQSSGITAQAIRRLRVASSSDAAWTQLAVGQSEPREKLKALQQRMDSIPSVFVPVMAEQPLEQRRETRLFQRGNWLTQGALVAPGIPAVFGAAEVHDRLQFAQWITSPEHPLFARVAVNRYWEQLFGHGIVASSEDFGTTSREPTHPELLDWLAVHFSTDLQFSVKRLLRELVLSATYRQDARATSEQIQRDPQNQLLARGPRQRLTAEMVRDQALDVAGLLSRKMGGPPVMPQQPEGIWRTVYNGGKWVTSPGDDAHRRGIYTFIRRTSGYPSALTFDAPTREYCTVRRIPTNTPLQALVTLNDPVYVEAAQSLGRRMEQSARSTREQLANGWQWVTGRQARPKDLEPLLQLHAEALRRFSGTSDAYKPLGNTPEGASLTLTANALLNLDTALTR